MSDELRAELPCFKCSHLMSDVDGHRIGEKIENPVKVASRLCLECRQEIEDRQWPRG